MKINGELNHNGKNVHEVIERCDAKDQDMLMALYSIISALSRSEPIGNETMMQQSIRAGFFMGTIGALFLDNAPGEYLPQPGNILASKIIEKLIAWAHDEEQLMAWATATKESVLEAAYEDNEELKAKARKLIDDGVEPMATIRMGPNGSFNADDLKDLPPEVQEKVLDMLANDDLKEGEAKILRIPRDK